LEADEELITKEAKLGSIDTCTAYLVAPVEALQDNIGLVLVPVEPFGGEERVGTDGIVTIVGVKILYNNKFKVPDGTFEIFPVVATLFNADCTDEGDDNGLDSRYKAATPVTCGAAIDVPEMVLVAVEEVYQADFIDDPGASKSTTDPKFEKEEKPSLEVVAPTVIASAVRAGE
jgi:hypothetical protein